MKTIFRLCILFLIAAASLRGEDFPMDHLKLVADGLNIEGGTIPLHYLKSGQVWANLCVVLDRPFEDGVEWQDLTSSNSFPLKEASILNYNEAQVNYAYALAMHYYLTHAHIIAKKPRTETAKVMIQVHRNTSGPCHLSLLEKILTECCPELKGIKAERSSSSKFKMFSYLFLDINIEAAFYYGSKNLAQLEKEYQDFDIILSLSLAAGLNLDWGSGTLLVPDQFIPFSLKSLIVSPQSRYSVQNHLKESISEIVRNQDEKILKIINEELGSLNIQKSHQKAEKLKVEDFKQATFLQVDGDFNPSNLPSSFTMELENPFAAFSYSSASI